MTSSDIGYCQAPPIRYSKLAVYIDSNLGYSKCLTASFLWEKTEPESFCKIGCDGNVMAPQRQGTSERSMHVKTVLKMAHMSTVLLPAPGPWESSNTPEPLTCSSPLTAWK